MAFVCVFVCSEQTEAMQLVPIHRHFIICSPQNKILFSRKQKIFLPVYDEQPPPQKKSKTPTWVLTGPPLGLSDRKWSRFWNWKAGMWHHDVTNTADHTQDRAERHIPELHDRPRPICLHTCMCVHVCVHTHNITRPSLQTKKMVPVLPFQI